MILLDDAGVAVLDGVQSLSADGARGDGWVTGQWTAENASLTGLRPPEPFVGGAYRLEGSVYVVHDQAALDTRVAVERDAIIRHADQVAKRRRDTLTVDVSAAEMASWSIKRGEALAYAASELAEAAPSLALEAQARGVGLDVLVEKVLDKASALSALEAAIAGRCGAIQDAARAAESLADLAAIDLDAGWPA